MAAIPKIDVHVHYAPSLYETALSYMNEVGIDVAINASGGIPGGGLEQSREIAARSHNRILYYCNFPFNLVESPDFVDTTRRILQTCKDEGAVGVKVFKALGLGIALSDGSLLRVDDPRLDVVFETAGALGLPVLIHSGDPKAFFKPPTPDNERFEELSAHPHWSFYGSVQGPRGPIQWPSWDDVFSQFEHRVARHPHTTFLGAHFGNDPEDPPRVGQLFERYPNLMVDTAARIPEIGRRDPKEMHDFFVRYQDRILFGTDLAVTPDGVTLGSRGAVPDEPSRLPLFFNLHWRYFETFDKNFESPTPIQGRWNISGIGLPREVLEKIYWKNAARLFHLGLPNIAAPADPRNAGAPAR